MPNLDALIDAIKTQDRQQIQALLDANPDLVHQRTEHGHSPVLFALYCGAPHLVPLFLEHGARLDVFEASALGDLKHIQSLIGADSTLLHAFSPDGWTPLHLACFFGHKDATKWLIDQGGQPRCTFHQCNPQHTASRRHCRCPKPCHHSLLARKWSQCDDARRWRHQPSTPSRFKRRHSFDQPTLGKRSPSYPNRSRSNPGRSSRRARFPRSRAVFKGENQLTVLRKL